MRLAATAFGLALALAPVSGFAHGELPVASHGGVMQEAGEMYLELVVRGNDVNVYVLDEARKPVPGARRPLAPRPSLWTERHAVRTASWLAERRCRPGAGRPL